MSIDKITLADELPTCSSSEASVTIQTNVVPTYDISSTETASIISTSSEEINDGNHVCGKTSVNPFFNLLRLYRLLPDGKGKSACRSAIEGAQIWRAMTPEEKDPFQRVALKESKRRFNRRRKQRADTKRLVALRTPTPMIRSRLRK